MDPGGRSDQTVVAVMQPYFAPYAGYYRLLAAADVFVIFDCVQFPRRGWVHRNRLPDAHGEAAWLTLPLEGAAYDAPIRDLVFAPDAEARMTERLRAFPSMMNLGADATDFLRPAEFAGSLVDYLEAQLRVAGQLLGVAPRLIRSSSLAIAPELRAQDRVLAILRSLQATDYVNAPGGRDLYDHDTFAACGVNLHFLPPWEGSGWSLLHRLATEAPTEIASEIGGQTPEIRQDGSRIPAA